MMVRVPTGVNGLDPLIEGGFLRGDLILLAGGIGCGKTIFSTERPGFRELDEHIKNNKS